VAEIIVASFR